MLYFQSIRKPFLFMLVAPLRGPPLITRINLLNPFKKGSRVISLVLNIKDDISGISLRDINVAFRKLAKVIHPDKAGDETTAAFQQLLDAYHKLQDYFKEKDDLGDNEIFETDDEERFFRENFERFNFPFANNGSFTVAIEDYLADTWQECLANTLGEPKVRRNTHGTECDRLWKVIYGAGEKVEITIHLYNNPKNKKGSKLMIQASRQSIICSYVFDELPRIYKQV